MIYYLMSCGCELKKEELIKTKTSKRYCCSKHSGILLKRKTYCDICNKTLISGLRGNPETKCKKHKREHHLKLMRDINRENRKLFKKYDEEHAIKC